MVLKPTFGSLNILIICRICKYHLSLTIKMKEIADSYLGKDVKDAVKSQIHFTQTIY